MIRKESMIILVQRGQAHTYNAQKWSQWAHPLFVEMCEPDELVTTLQVQQHLGFTHVWIADSSYEPLPTSFRNYLSRQIWKDSVFTLFRVGRPTFIRAFYEDKFTATHDTHDKYGGLRYMQIEAAISDSTPLEFDVNCGGVPIDFLEQQASKLSFPYSVFQLSSNEMQVVVMSGFEAIRRFYPSVANHYSEDNILESHRTLAQKSDSDMFIVIDADCLLTASLGVENFQAWDEKYVHVWYVRNPINGLVYGHGGPKAFNRNAFAELEPETVDVCTSANRKQMIVHPQEVGIHKFNWSAEASFRTAFREAAKLTWVSNDNLTTSQAAQERLLVWLNEDMVDKDQPYWEECIDGADMGHEWASECADEERVLINDFEWLSKKFAEYNEAVEMQVEDFLKDADEQEPT